jgi:hypothetical protein
MAKPAGNRIRAAQLEWAKATQIALDKDGYCPELNTNLFQPLSACSRRDFEAGDGAELGKNGARGKLQAVHSSSALACNTFDFWRGRDLELVGAALGLPERPCSMRLEAQFKTGLRGTPPNLDVAFEGVAGTTSAIESKFTEPYTKSKSKSHLKDKYFPQDQKLWAGHGLHAAQEMAESLRGGHTAFTHVDAAQLLKHCLGLAHSTDKWTLTYLWYNAGGDEGEAHRLEAARFIEALKADNARATALSYQEFFSRLTPTLPTSAAGYRQYLESRYFPHRLA